jgi:hypothetical protein
MKRMILMSLALVFGSVVLWGQMQSISYGVAIPPYPDSTAGSPSLTVCTIDAVDEECAQVFVASSTKSIDKIYFMTGTVTTGETVDVRVEGVDAADGDPDDALIATNTNIAVVIADGDDNVWKTATLTADASLTRGTTYAIVVKGPGAGTPNLTINGFGDDTAEGIPYRDNFAGGVWTKTTASQAVFLIEFTDGTFETQLGLTGAGTNLATVISINTGTTTTRECNELTLPVSARASGAWGWIDGDGAYTLQLRASDGTTVLATTAAQDPEVRAQTTPGLYHLPFTASYTLVANTTYQVCAVPSTVTSIGVFRFTVPSAAAMRSFAGGTTIYRTNNDSGDVTTDRLYLGLFLDGFSSGGGRPRIIGG